MKPYAKIDRGNHGNIAVAFKWGQSRRGEPRRRKAPRTRGARALRRAAKKAERRADNFAE